MCIVSSQIGPEIILLNPIYLTFFHLAFIILHLTLLSLIEQCHHSIQHPSLLLIIIFNLIRPTFHLLNSFIILLIFPSTRNQFRISLCSLMILKIDIKFNIQRHRGFIFGTTSFLNFPFFHVTACIFF